MPNCIFHIPYNVDLDWPSGSNIRPIKMIDAFKKIGYNVDVVIGYGKERKEQIKIIKDKIKKGCKYNFVYSESSTEPTLLTEKNHIPKYPLLDFQFLGYCKKSGINIGLFYRDVYWRFDVYKSVPFMKRNIAKIFYKYDLHKYNECLDILYLPSKLMYKYIPFNFKGNIEELPPAINEEDINDIKNNEVVINKKSNLKIFYVGGISNLYNIEKLFESVSKNDNIELTVCCREKEWEDNKRNYLKYINNRIKIIHKSGEELKPYFKEADIFSLFFEPVEYRTFAMPVKLFEYLTYIKPIIATNGTATGEFVDRNNIGWSVEYSTEELSNILNYISENRENIIEKIENIKKILHDNTWKARAKKIERDLTT